MRDRLQNAQPEWLVLAVALEALSCLSYLLMFKPIFCARMTWRSAYELSQSELAVGSLVPASGAGGLALGAWALRKGGMPAEDIARRTVAFFVIKSSVNFVAVAVIGIAMWLGVGPHVSPWLTILPAVLSIITLAGVALIPLLAGRRPPRAGASKPTGWRRFPAAAAAALGDGTREVGTVLARRDWRVIVGSIGYWAFDNAVLWACFKAFGYSPRSRSC